MAKKRRTRKQSRAGAAVDAFDAYYHDDSLESWQRMMADLDIDGHFPSKTQCRKVCRPLPFCFLFSVFCFIHR